MTSRGALTRGSENESPHCFRSGDGCRFLAPAEAFLHFRQNCSTREAAAPAFVGMAAARGDKWHSRCTKSEVPAATTAGGNDRRRRRAQMMRGKLLFSGSCWPRRWRCLMIILHAFAGALLPRSAFSLPVSAPEGAGVVSSAASIPDCPDCGKVALPSDPAPPPAGGSSSSSGAKVVSVIAATPAPAAPAADPFGISSSAQQPDAAQHKAQFTIDALRRTGLDAFLGDGKVAQTNFTLFAPTVRSLSAAAEPSLRCG